MEKLIIGSHVSFKKDSQLLGSLEEALSYDANTFMIYTGAPQNTNRVPIDDSLTYKALLKMKEKNIDLRNIIVHAPYIINPANSKNLDFAISFLTQEIERTEKLGLTKLVLHPGSHVNLGEEV
ncbi:MAG: deoxyribonuclease IV, partial [Bacilli bacterium]